MSIFEAGMLLCFGAAWPVNIYKSAVSRSTGGKSVAFLVIIEAGYICGIINKILNNNDIVLFLYILNFVMVAVDICLYCRNKQYERGKGV
jgi:hypothetical protein